MFKVHTILLHTDPTSLLGISSVSYVLLKYPRAAGTNLRVRASGDFPLYFFVLFSSLFIATLSMLQIFFSGFYLAIFRVFFPGFY